MSDYNAIAKARADASEALIQADVLGLPPGYIQGFSVTLDSGRHVTIGAGITSVEGRQVSNTEEHDIVDEDFIGTRLGNYFYYIYLTSSGEYKVDRIIPEYSDRYYYYAHPLYNYRCLGIIYVYTSAAINYVNDIIYASKNYNGIAGTVTMAAYGSLETIAADYICEGSGDEEFFNMAINFLYSAYSGGIVHLSKGVYKTDGAITLQAGVVLEGEGNATIIEKNCNDYAIECVGGSGTEILNSGLRDLKVTRNAADTNDIYLVYINYADDWIMQNVLVDDAYSTGLYITNCDRFLATGLQVYGFGVAGTPFGICIFTTTGHLNNVIVDGESTAQTTELIGVYLGNGTNASNIIVKNLNSSNRIYGIYMDGADAQISNVIVENIDCTGAATAAGGVTIAGSRCLISGMKVSDIDNTATAANSRGIFIESAIDNCVISGIMVSGCSGTGVLVNAATCDRNILVGRSTGNGTNLTDNGTNTNTAAFDAT